MIYKTKNNTEYNTKYNILLMVFFCNCYFLHTKKVFIFYYYKQKTLNIEIK